MRVASHGPGFRLTTEIKLPTTETPLSRRTTNRRALDARAEARDRRAEARDSAQHRTAAKAASD